MELKEQANQIWHFYIFICLVLVRNEGMPNRNIREPVQIPVFVIPTSLSFSVQDETTHKQVLTLFNPCQFDVLLSTAPNKYEITDSSGFLKAGFKIDIVVRHSYPIESNVGARDKLRVEMRMNGNPSLIGKRDISLTLVKELPRAEASRGSSYGFTPFHVILAILAVAVLMMPTEGIATTSVIPNLFHFSVATKCFVSFVLVYQYSYNS
ncbi:Motile sperm domain-containing protein 1 [Armadillidium nasatum]|uniref:Motile sperm domain-containing protein 1 n=1 Tax=Armadillidium nasatum TaxID=96803 RepID=A0A5N5T6S0_9CRUS|nr:Motile sperm domain-containing protein 1 [Armadillidium nasatum]